MGRAKSVKVKLPNTTHLLPREIREQAVLQSSNNTRGGIERGKLQQFLAQDNVQEFQLELLNKTYGGYYKTGCVKHDVYIEPELCEREISEYFKLCYRTKMIPTISSLALYLGGDAEEFFCKSQRY